MKSATDTIAPDDPSVIITSPEEAIQSQGVPYETNVVDKTGTTQNSYLPSPASRENGRRMETSGIEKAPSVPVGNALESEIMTTEATTPTSVVKEQQTTSTETNWQNPADTEISFKRTVHDFGKLIDGEETSTLFVFTNTGKNPLEIEIVSACYCLSTDYTSGLIMPGEQGNIDITFDSNDQVGNVKKDIDVIFKNTDKDGYPLIKRLTLRGKVLPKK